MTTASAQSPEPFPASADAAFVVLDDRYRARLEAYCRTIVRNDDDARDAVQNALTKALVALRRGSRPEAERAWLFRIAHNEAISLMRSRRSHDDLEGAEMPAPGSDPAHALIVREELTEALGQIRALPPRARQALVLRELAELGYDDVAAVLGCSAATARQAVHEARCALLADRAALAEPCSAIRAELTERRRPNRRTRGHLRGCGPCRSWSEGQRRRSRWAFLPAGFGLGPLGGWLGGLLGGTSTTVKVATTVAVIAAAAPVARHEVEARREHPVARATVAPSPADDAGTTRRSAARAVTGRDPVLPAATLVAVARRGAATAPAESAAAGGSTGSTDANDSDAVVRASAWLQRDRSDAARDAETRERVGRRVRSRPGPDVGRWNARHAPATGERSPFASGSRPPGAPAPAGAAPRRDTYRPPGGTQPSGRSAPAPAPAPDGRSGPGPEPGSSPPAPRPEPGSAPNRGEPAPAPDGGRPRGPQPTSDPRPSPGSQPASDPRPSPGSQPASDPRPSPGSQPLGSGTPSAPPAPSP